MEYSRKGFTLIELLVVIAIIGLLSSVVFASLNSARVKARNARRVSDLKQLSTALELYYDANNNAYPDSGSTWRGNCSDYGSHGTSGATGYIPNLAPTYIPSLPLDPAPSGTGGCYLYFSNGANYALLAHNNPEINYSSRPELFDPTRDSGTDPCVVDGSAFWAWKVSSPGGRCW
ncbi:MAG: type II secretion system protein [bacterium]|nr:type II secretion system protein [bacterium]